MIIQTEVVKADEQLEELGIRQAQALDVDLSDVSGVSPGDHDDETVLLFKGYHLVIKRDYEQTRLEWLQTKQK